MSTEYIALTIQSQVKHTNKKIYFDLVESFDKNTRLVLGYLATFFEARIPIFPSIKTISKHTQIPKRTVERILKRMKGLGVLQVIERCYNSSNVYDFNAVFRQPKMSSLIWSLKSLYQKSGVLTVKVKGLILNKVIHYTERLASKVLPFFPKKKNCNKDVRFMPNYTPNVPPVVCPEKEFTIWVSSKHQESDINLSMLFERDIIAKHAAARQAAIHEQNLQRRKEADEAWEILKKDPLARKINIHNLFNQVGGCV